MKKRKPKGFTLLELLVALPIGAAIVFVIVSSTFQIVQGRTGIAGKSAAMSDIDSAIHWLARDLPLAQTTTLVGSDNLTLEWNDLTGWAQTEEAVEYYVNYSLSGTQLLRDYNGEVTTVGRYITDVSFSIDGKMFTVTLTSRPGLPGSEVTRRFTIQMRAEEET